MFYLDLIGQDARKMHIHISQEMWSVNLKGAEINSYAIVNLLSVTDLPASWNMS